VGRRLGALLGVVVAVLMVATACGPRIDVVSEMRNSEQSGLSASRRAAGEAAGDGAGQAVSDGLSQVGTPGPQGGAAGAGAAPGSSPGVKGSTDNGGATDTGLSATSISVGGSAAVSGPIPGQFFPSIQGIDSFFKVLNEQGGVYGRKIVFRYYDDALNPDTYRQNVTRLIREDKVFALTGSMSAADNGGCGHTGDVPDIGTFAINYCRGQAKYHYSPLGSLNNNVYGTTEQVWLEEKFGYSKPAAEYLTVPASADEGIAMVDGLVRTLKLKSRDDVYHRGNEATQPDYNAEILSLRSQGVDAVFSSMDLPSNVRLIRAMCQQDYRPKFVHVELASYEPSFIAQLSDSCLASQNIWMRSRDLPFSRTDNAEMRLYLSSLKRFYPDAQPSPFGIEGWLTGKLFAEALRAVGPRLTRAKLVAALDATRDWTGGGIIGPTTPAKRLPNNCNAMLHVEKREFAQKTDFICGPFYKIGDYTGGPIGP